MAAEKNLDVKAELYNPALAESDIRKSRAIYDPLLTALTNYSESTSANPTQLSAAVGGNNINKTKTIRTQRRHQQTYSLRRHHRTCLQQQLEPQ